MSDNYCLLANIRLSTQLEEIKSQFKQINVRVEYKEGTKGTLLYVHPDDYEKAQSVVIDLRIEEVDGGDLSVDDSGA